MKKTIIYFTLLIVIVSTTYIFLSKKGQSFIVNDSEKKIAIYHKKSGLLLYRNGKYFNSIPKEYGWTCFEIEHFNKKKFEVCYYRKNN